MQPNSCEFSGFGSWYSSDLRASGSLRVVGWFVVDVSGEMSKEKACFLHILTVEHEYDMLSRDSGDKPTYDAPDSPEERNLNIINVCPPDLAFWTVAPNDFCRN